MHTPKSISIALALTLVLGLASCKDEKDGAGTNTTDTDTTDTDTDTTPPNSAPVAEAGDDLESTVSEVVTLDGTASTDADGDDLTFTWEITSAPAGSTATLDDANSTTPSLTPDLTGIYTFSLTVSDGAEESSDTLTLWVCEAWLDMLPVPVDKDSSVFPDVDDDFVELTFLPDFSFTFYGSVYDSVFVNTNGGLTFGAGSSDYEDPVPSYTDPGIGIFWTDLDAEEYGGEYRANQLLIQSCPHKYVLAYTDYQSNDEDDELGTATVTLESDGTFTIDYGTVSLTDVAVGVWDGTHTDNQTMAIQPTYQGYSSMGTGIVLWDYYTDSVYLNGELDNQSLTFIP